MPLTLASGPAGEGKQASTGQRSEGLPKSSASGRTKRGTGDVEAGHRMVWKREHCQAPASGMKGALHGVCGVLVVGHVLCVGVLGVWGDGLGAACTGCCMCTVLVAWVVW